MWLFLITEVMFFGGLFLAYMLYRVWYPEAWAEGSYQLNLTLGTVNTVVLIGSSLTMALAVRGAQTGLRRATVVWLMLTMVARPRLPGHQVLRVRREVHAPSRARLQRSISLARTEPQVQIYFSLYFLMTGLHATHMLIGFGLLSVIAWMAHKSRFSPEWYTPVEMSGLYWHFVDIVWIFLFPLLYLVDRAHPAG